MFLEVNLVVSDCREAVAFYQHLFHAAVKSISDLPKGSNEAIITIEDFHIHLFEANEAFQMRPPKEAEQGYMWWHVIVEDAKTTEEKGLAAGCKSIEAVIDKPEYQVKQGIVKDPFGYVWILTEIK